MLTEGNSSHIQTRTSVPAVCRLITDNIGQINTVRAAVGRGFRRMHEAKSWSQIGRDDTVAWDKEKLPYRLLKQPLRRRVHN